MDIQLTSKKDVENLIQHLEGQGFKCHRVVEHFISSKIISLIKQANVMDLDFDHALLIHELKLTTIDSFNKMKRVLDDHFSKFGKEDKIRQLISALYPICVEKIVVPAVHASAIDHSIFQQQLRKYEISNLPSKDGQQVSYLQIYVFKPQKLRIYLEGRFSTLQSLIQLVYGKDVDIDVKTFANGNADLKGDIEPLRQCYIKYLTSMDRCNIIIQ